MVIDDAASEAQVRPLLPGGSGCGVLVTSRRPLAGLEGARLVDLDVFDLEQALELLSRIAGQARVVAEPAAATRIVHWCGRLPLAVRIAGTRLLAEPHWTLADLAARLGDECRRLDELAAGDLEVRASVRLSYQGLDRLQRRAFCPLGDPAGLFGFMRPGRVRGGRGGWCGCGQGDGRSTRHPAG